MKLTRQQLEEAVSTGILSREQAERLMAFLRSRPGAGPDFDFTHILYYAGGLVAIGAMTLFMNLGWERFGGWGILAISLAYGAVGLWLAAFFRSRGHAVPSGICAAFAVALVPLAIYGLQQAMGWWPSNDAYRDYHRYVRWHWIYMELGTLAAGAAIARIFRYPFLLMPLAATLWYLSMDSAVMLAGGRPDFEFRALVSLYFGLCMCLLALWVDLRSARSADYAFWLYIFGVLTFWGGLTAQNSDNELSKFLYLCVNLLMIATGAALARRVFVVFGALGAAIYLGHLAREVFRDSWFFPVALTAMGLGMICCGILWQKNEERIGHAARAILPPALRDLLEARGKL